MYLKVKLSVGKLCLTGTWNSTFYAKNLIVKGKNKKEKYPDCEYYSS
jgi:hypothetical protein